MLQKIGRNIAAMLILILVVALSANAADLVRIEVKTDKVDLIIVDIGDQKLYVCRIEILREVVISTAEGGYNVIGGKIHPKKPHNHLGRFSIYKKDKDHYSGLYDCPMPYSMFFHGGHAIHATSLEFYSLLGIPASHGCVRTHLDDAKWLFKHTPLGAKVIVVP